MVWIIGSNGMLGRHITEQVENANIPLITSDKEIDITDITAIRGFLENKTIDWIIICAAFTAVDLAEDEENNAFAVNAEGVKNITEICKNTGVKIVSFSSDYVFPGENISGYHEDDRTGPMSVYGRSKLKGEMFLMSGYKEYFIFRISWLYGPYGKNFVHTMLNRFNEQDELNVVNDQFGSPTYTLELADFIVKLIETNSQCYDLYHFSGEGMTTWYEFSMEIYRLALKYGITQKTVKINPIDSSKFPAKAKRPMYSYLHKNKLTSTFGFKPEYWRDTLENYIKSLI